MTKEILATDLKISPHIPSFGPECRPTCPRVQVGSSQPSGGPVCYRDIGAPSHRHWHGKINASRSRLKLWYANANTMYHLFVLWSQWEAPTAPPPPPFPFLSPLSAASTSPASPRRWSRGEARMEPSSLPEHSLFCLRPFFLSVSCPLRLSEAPEASPFPLSSLSLLFFISCLLTLTLAMKNREVLT